MNRNEFVENLNKTNAYTLKHKGKRCIVTYDHIVFIEDFEHGHMYKDFDELFEAKVGDKTFGELVDALKTYDLDFIYHLPMVCLDENGDVSE